MKIIFLSNFFNHHQVSLSDFLYKKTGGNYIFISTCKMPIQQIELGYQLFTRNYIIELDGNNEESIKEKISEYDVAILGDAPQNLIRHRLRTGKITFFYSERIYKKEENLLERPLRFVKYWYEKGRFKNAYMLCASAFTSMDYYKTKTFVNKCFKFGYFPKLIKYDINMLLNSKQKNSILWVGRLIDWKHPEQAVFLADLLKTKGYNFRINIIGTGYMYTSIKQMIDSMGLQDCVTLLGPVQSDKVRSYMEKSSIFISTSDRNEGWGATINESMNSGCAVIASHSIGSVPYLLQNNKNGLVYHSGNMNELFQMVSFLLDNPKEQIRLGLSAFNTIVTEWNAEVAAERLINLCRCLSNGTTDFDTYESGPCSKAELFKDEWV